MLLYHSSVTTIYTYVCMVVKIVIFFSEIKVVLNVRAKWCAIAEICHSTNDVFLCSSHRYPPLIFTLTIHISFALFTSAQNFFPTIDSRSAPCLISRIITRHRFFWAVSVVFLVFLPLFFYHLLFPAHCDRLKFLSHRIRRGTARYGTLPYGACTLPYGTRFYVKAATHGAVPCRMRFEITLVWLFSELLSAPWLSSSSSLSWSLIQTKCP